jgi:hypothetical protein
MALKKNITIDGNVLFVTAAGTIDRGVEQVELKDCYIKVEGVSASKEIASASVSLTKDALSIARAYEFVPTMDGGNFIAQAYEHLKTLPEFADAVDC